MIKRYEHSEQLLQRALQSIPLGSQTFSKSHTQFPQGGAPFFIQKGKGAHIWDVDGNEYIDYVISLLAVLLGYCDPDVDRAVMEQMQNGVTFSLAHTLEMQVAEKIIEMVPCAEMVRFGKNGSDATAGAIRLARAYTKRDHVAVCGYHGWQDWYIGSTSRNLGVPQAVQDLTHRFNYNDLPSLEKLFAEYPGQIAAVILEPMHMNVPQGNFLQQVKEVAHHYGALLIFDEVVTGFRVANGGAQSLFNVTPDLASIGKGMGNGYPISAIVGRRDVMKLMEDVFFSFTFGGETISLAATLATLTKLQTQPVLETIAKHGKMVQEGVKSLISAHQLDSVISFAGHHPALTGLTFKDVNKYSLWEIKTFFMQEMLKRGILTYGSHNICYAHTEADVQYLLRMYDEVFDIIHAAIGKQALHEQINCQVLKPLFSVR